MRLWHIALIPVLPRQQLNGGWTFRCKVGYIKGTFMEMYYILYITFKKKIKKYKKIVDI